MPDFTPEQVAAGIALYSRPFLAIYDWFALGLGLRLLWGCPSRHMLDLYNRFVTANHLDIGVGTGYFMDRCRFPSPNPRLVLMDLNTNSLDFAARRLARYHPEVGRANALEPLPADLAPFDSIGIMNLLHCLPGDMTTKSAVLRNIKDRLKPGGVIFGSSILYRGVRRHPLAAATLAFNNWRGIMTNKNDDVEVLKENLRQLFTESEVRIIGCVALFRAKKE